MSGSSTTPSKLVPIAAKPATTTGTLKESQSTPLPVTNNGASTSNNNGNTGSASIRKIAPRPDDVPKLPLMAKIAPKPIEKPPCSQDLLPGTSTITGSHQKMREVDSSAEQRQQSATGQTLRPVAPVLIAPRPNNPSTIASNLGQVNSSLVGSVPITTQAVNKKQILPKPIEKKPSQMSNNNTQNPIVGQLNGNLIGVFPNGTFRIPTGQTQHNIPQSMVRMTNPNFSLSYNAVNQQQALQQLQMSYLLQQQQQVQHQQQQQQKTGQQLQQQKNMNPSIFPIGQHALLQPQLSIASNNGTMYMISNPQMNRSSLSANIMSQMQAQQFRLANPTMSIAPTVYAKQTLISGVPQNGVNGNPVILRPQFVTPMMPTISSPNQPPPPTLETSTKPEGINGSDDDENEPPPLLDRDETLASDVNDIFIQEAVAARQTRSAEILRHVIDGFVIEESDKPFELDISKLSPLEILRRAREEDPVETPKKKRTKNIKTESVTNVTKSESLPVIPPVSTGAKRGRKPNPEKLNDIKKSPIVKAAKSPTVERPPSTKKHRELAQLLTMDFGPGKTPFKTTSPQEYAKEIQKQQTALRPTIQMNYHDDDSEFYEREISTSVAVDSSFESSDTCQGCFKTFAELGRRNNKYPQYCSKECRKYFKLLRKNKKRSNDSLDSSLNESTDSPKKIKMRLSTDEVVETGSFIHSTDSTPSTSHQNLISQDSVSSIPSPLPSIVPPPTAASSSSDYLKCLSDVNLDPRDVNNWGLGEVVKFVNCISNSEASAESFLKEEIDGASLLILEERELKQLGLKMGPYLKLGKAIEWLKTLN